MKTSEALSRIRSRDFLAAVIIVSFVGIVFALFAHAVPEGNRELFAALAGGLASQVPTVTKHYFPSDQSSEAKTNTIADQAKALANTEPKV